MPRRFFRKFSFKRDAVSERWFMAPFRHLLHDHRFWGVRRRTVVPAFAVGVFVAFMPFPGHPIWASFVALAARINVPIALITTFISNPLTMGPMYYFNYRAGAWLLGRSPQPFQFEMSINWVTHTFVNLWQPMLLGSLVVGGIAGGASYVILNTLWRASVGNYKSRKRRQRDS